MYIKFCEPLCAFTGLLVTLMVTRKHGECRCTLKYLGAAVEQMKQIKYQCCEPFCAFTGLPFQVGTSNPNGLPGNTANAAVQEPLRTILRFHRFTVTLMVTRKHGECRCTHKYLGAAVEQMNLKRTKCQCCEPFCAFTGSL